MADIVFCKLLMSLDQPSAIPVDTHGKSCLLFRYLINRLSLSDRKARLSLQIDFSTQK